MSLELGEAPTLVLLGDITGDVPTEGDTVGDTDGDTDGDVVGDIVGDDLHIQLLGSSLVHSRGGSSQDW